MIFISYSYTALSYGTPPHALPTFAPVSEASLARHLSSQALTLGNSSRVSILACPWNLTQGKVLMSARLYLPLPSPAR